MFLRWLLIALIIYLIYRLITGPKRKKRKNNPFFTFHYGKFNNDQNRKRNRGKRNLDQIEEAEYEDITEEKDK